MVNNLKPKKRYRRGYAVAMLVGMEEDSIALWRVFSKVVKPEKTLHINGARSNSKDLYNFHESLVNALRPTLKEGVRSVILASPARTNYHQEFINHVDEHHKWLTQGVNKAAFSKITGSATTPHQVAALTRTQTFRQLISKTTKEETENLIEILDKRINTTDNDNLVLFSLEEAEKLILRRRKPSKPKSDYLMLTNKYLAETRQRNRLHRLIQIAINKKVKTRIISADTPAGKRLTQLGGFVCLAQLD
jgi:stalled ribosome rescue protein Dom34